MTLALARGVFWGNSGYDFEVCVDANSLLLINVIMSPWILMSSWEMSMSLDSYAKLGELIIIIISRVVLRFR